MKLLNTLERKFGKYAIKNLMSYIVFANAIVYILSFVNQRFVMNLMFDPNRVLHGEVWRIFTFLFIPPVANWFFILFALYINYMIGNALEYEWGSFKFNCYYFLGMMGIILGAFISGLSMSNYYLSLSLFLAFAKLYPDHEFLLFFVLPVKVKYLGWFSWFFFFLGLIIGPMSVRIATLIAIINYFIFFGKDIIIGRKQATSNYSRKKSYTKSSTVKRDHLHQCDICGRTEQDDPDLEFRICSKCDGHHEYCFEHLFEHQHIKDN